MQKDLSMQLCLPRPRYAEHSLKEIVKSIEAWYRIDRTIFRHEYTDDQWYYLKSTLDDKYVFIDYDSDIYRIQD